MWDRVREGEVCVSGMRERESRTMQIHANNIAAVLDHKRAPPVGSSSAFPSSSASAGGGVSVNGIASCDALFSSSSRSCSISQCFVIVASLRKWDYDIWT